MLCLFGDTVTHTQSVISKLLMTSSRTLSGGKPYMPAGIRDRTSARREKDDRNSLLLGRSQSHYDLNFFLFTLTIHSEVHQ